MSTIGKLVFELAKGAGKVLKKPKHVASAVTEGKSPVRVEVKALVTKKTKKSFKTSESKGHLYVVPKKMPASPQEVKRLFDDFLQLETPTTTQAEDFLAQVDPKTWFKLPKDIKKHRSDLEILFQGVNHDSLTAPFLKAKASYRMNKPTREIELDNVKWFEITSDADGQTTQKLIGQARTYEDGHQDTGMTHLVRVNTVGRMRDGAPGSFRLYGSSDGKQMRFIEQRVEGPKIVFETNDGEVDEVDLSKTLSGHGINLLDTLGDDFRWRIMPLDNQNVWKYAQVHPSVFHLFPAKGHDVEFL